MPFWAAADLLTTSVEPLPFKVSLEDIVAGTGRLVDGDLSNYEASGVRFQPGDILFGKLRPYLAKYWLADRDGTAGGDIHVYRPTPEVEPRFLKHVVGTRDFVRYAEAASKGTKMPRVEWSALREFRVRRFNLSEQRRIADYLDRETAEIDAMDAELDRLVETLRERRIHTVEDALRGDFDIVPLWSATDDVVDCPHTTPKIDPEGVAEAVRTASVRNGRYLPGNGLRVSAGTAAERNGAYPPVSGDVFFTREAPAGEACLVPEGHFCLGQRMVLLKPCRTKLDGAFLVHALYTGATQDGFIHSAGGSTVVNLKLSTIRSTRIPLPPISEQRRIVAELDEQTARIDDMIADAQRLKALLAERRSTLITEVVTGRKEVPA